MSYNKQVSALFFDTRHAGVLDCEGPLTVCKRIQLAPNQCSELYLQCDDRGLITRAQFKASGSPYLIAGLEWLCRTVLNTALEVQPIFSHTRLVEELHIPKAQYAVALLVETIYLQAIHLLKQQFLEKKHG